MTTQSSGWLLTRREPRIGDPVEVRTMRLDGLFVSEQWRVGHVCSEPTLRGNVGVEFDGGERRMVRSGEWR